MGKRSSHILRDTVVFTVPDGVLFREQHFDKLKQTIKDYKITKLAILIIGNNIERRFLLHLT